VPFLLDLLRHGEALPATGSGGDAARQLSPLGERDVARVAEELARLGRRPDRAFTSPFPRARKTAAIVLTRLGGGLAPEDLRELVPDHGPGDVVEALAARRVSGHVLLVGHQPLLGQLAAHLTGGPEPPFPPGGLVRIAFAEDLAAGRGRIETQLRPEHLP